MPVRTSAAWLRLDQSCDEIIPVPRGGRLLDLGLIPSTASRRYLMESRVQALTGSEITLVEFVLTYEPATTFRRDQPAQYSKALRCLCHRGPHIDCGRRSFVGYSRVVVPENESVGQNGGIWQSIRIRETR